MNSEASVMLVDKEIESLVAEVATAENFRDYKIETTDGSMKGDGYIGIITSIKILGKNKENENSVLNLVVKSASKSDALRSKMPVACIFNREIYMYSNVFSTFQQFEIEKGLQPSYFAPKFYKANLSEKSEALVLENLKERGYRLVERRIPMNNDHVSLVMAHFGRMHAVSFALRDQNPEKFEKVVGCMDDILIKFLKNTFFNTLKHRCTKAVQSLEPKTDQNAILKFQKLIHGLELFLDELRETVDEFSVALHCDSWTNNMMFNYEDPNNPTKPTQVRLIDFQVAALGLPVLDLSYYIYACSSTEVINNLEYYLRVYYNSLCSYVRELGSDPEKLFPYSVLQQQWKKFSKFGLIVSTMTIHGVLSEKDEIIDYKDMAEAGKNVGDALTYEISNVDQYNNRIRPIILHLAENDFI